MAYSDTFYNRMVTIANRLIDKYGATYTVYTPNSYDSVTMTSVGETSRVVSGIVTTEKNSFIFGKSIETVANTEWSKTSVLMLKASALLLHIESVEIDGVRYSLKNVQTIKPAEIILLYKLSLTR